MDIKSLKTLLKVLRDSGVTKYTTSDIHLELTDLPSFKENSKSQSTIPEDYQAPTEEDTLFYSSIPSLNPPSES